MRNRFFNVRLGMNARPGILAMLALGVVAVGATSFMPFRPATAADEKKDEKSKNVVSRDLSKPLKAAQDLTNDKKYPEAIAKLNEAEASAKKTPYDEHVINELAAVAYYRNGDLANAEKAFEALVEDGFVDPQEMAVRLKGAAQLNYQLKNYDKAADYGNRAIKGGFEDDDIDVIVGQAYYLKQDYPNALKFESDLIDKDVKAGKTPKEQSLKLLKSSCVNLHDSACTTKALEKIIAYYPDQQSWQELLYSIAQEKATNQSDKTTLQLYRLISDVDVFRGAEDYTEMAQLALEAGSPGEAQHVLEKGFQKGVFADARSKDTNQRLLDNAKKTAAADEASLPKTEKDAEAASTGDKAIGVGFAYLGYGQYDKASDMLAKGLKKGGVKSEPEARLLLGIAQLKAGHKEEAVQSFQAVKGDPTLERLANLWSLHAKQA